MHKKSFVIRSFVRRQGRFTKGQREAIKNFWPTYGIELTSNEINLENVFNNKQPTILDIGFGNGEALAELGKSHPHLNFLGIEVYQPGIGSLLKRIKEKKLNNIRVVNGDVNDLLKQSIAVNSFISVLIWFPDPWHKKRHHKRRLIKTEFLKLLETKLMCEGELYIVTDWQPYADHIYSVLENYNSFKRVAESKFIKLRPTTKFERRGNKLGHGVYSFIYRRNY